MSEFIDLIRDVAKRYYITNFDAQGIIRFIRDDIMELIGRDGDFRIEGFGKFYLEDDKVLFKPDPDFTSGVKKSRRKWSRKKKT